VQSEKIEALALALVQVQGNLKPAIKDSKNPFFKSSYADLTSVWEACREQLAKNDLAVFQGCETHDGSDFLTTTVMHKSGQWIKSEIRLLLTKQDAQGMGSAITYARRYSLAAAIGIVQDDDDGNAASQEKSFTQEARETAQANGQKPDAVSMLKAGKQRANSIIDFIDSGLFTDAELQKVLTKYRVFKAEDLSKDTADKIIAACVAKDINLRKGE
jgi:hypothetical protein